MDHDQGKTCTSLRCNESVKFEKQVVAKASADRTRGA